jgi:aminopeptidase N
MVLGLGLILPAATAAATSVRHHDLRVVLHPESGLLEGEDTLLIAPGDATQVELRLAPSCAVEAVRVAGEGVPFEWIPGRLTVRLAAVAAGQKIRLQIIYSGTFRDPVPDNPITTEDPTYGVAAAITPQGTFLSGGAAWYPDIPGSLATFRLRLLAPEGTEGVSPGGLLERGAVDGLNYSIWETDHPLPSLSLAAGHYLMREEKVGSIPVYTFFRAETAGLERSYLEAAKGYLELYQGLFGPYPFEKFAIAENFFPTGYGFPSWTLLGSSVVRLPFIVETSLGHEIAHSWWGNGVRADYAGGNWSEGLTTYVADYLYRERSSSEEARQYRVKILRDYATLVPAAGDFPLSAFSRRSSAAGQAVGYGKGAMVFHMLRRLIGEEAFWNALRRVAQSRMHETASWNDLAGIFAKESGRDLSPFFRQWVDRAGAPVLGLEMMTVSKGEDRWQVSGRLLQREPYFDLQVPLRLETENDAVEATVELRGATAPFILRGTGEPRRLIVDPGADLFRRLDQTEIPPTVNGIRGSTDLLVVASRTLPPETLVASRILLTALRQEQARIVSEENVGPSELAGKDILFLGLPSDRKLLPPLPKGLTVGAEGCTLDGESFSGIGVALFAALPHPTDSDRVAAIFLPFSADAARQAARKISHYGKFSYLVFASGINRSKGTWTVAASPTIHLFSDKETTP